MHTTTPASTQTVPDFDPGPLSWVQVEIGQALARGRDLLAAFRAAPSNPGLLVQARNCIHQAAGAIQMVGLDAVVVYTDEIERQLARLAELSPPAIEPSCANIDRACQKLVLFLEELVGGAPPVPLNLFPEYEAMQRERGIKVAAATDLFFPARRLRGPLPGAPLPVAAENLAAHLRRQRRVYQSGLLAFLRGDGVGARKMRDAAVGLERVSVQESARVFWWTVGAFFDAIIAGGLEPGFGAKQLAARLDLQIRRVVEGSTKVAGRLRREVLYYVAVSAPVTPVVRSVQDGFGLAGLIPTAAALNADLVRLQPILREMREQLAAAKNIWLKVTLGRAESLPRLQETLRSVHGNAEAIGNEALTRLTASLVNRLDAMPPSGDVPDAVAMEYATAILLAESAVENRGGLADNFPEQVAAMLSRLDAAQAARPLPAATGSLIDEIFRRAQERILVAQVAREMQANLRHMEQVLDAFFRDHAKRSELATLGKDSMQIRGALRMLEQDDAERLLGLCQEQIESYASPDTAVDDVDLELLAESLAGLGFFVEAFEQQRPNRQRLIAPLLARRLGEAPAVEEDRAAETVEDAVTDLRNTLPELVAEMHRAPADPAARAELVAKLNDLVDDATLIDDAELVAQAQAALAKLESGGTVELEAAVSAIADSGGAVATPAPAISAETQRLLAVDAKGLDAELLEIYLIEAAEVLDTVATNRGELERNPGDREALRTVRRQFHTLKGSGRMVGLTELGELAWAVEQVHNRLLEEERVVSPAALAMIEVAETNFRHWIGALKDTGSVAADPTELHAAIGRAEAELPADAESAAQTPVVVAVRELPPDIGTVLTEPVAAAAAGPDRGPQVGDEAVEAGGQPPAWVAAMDSGEDVGTEIIEFAPTGAMPAGANADAEAPAPPDVIAVGEARIPAGLFPVLVEEAQTHLATLRHELSLLQFDSGLVPSEAMVRASHTLCGIHRAGGLPLIASTAGALEQALLALQQLRSPMPVVALPTLADAVGGLGEFIARVKARDGFNAMDEAIAAEIRQELEAVRKSANIVPVAPDIEVLPEYGQLGAEPEPAYAEDVLPVAVAPMADVPPPQDSGVVPPPVASPPPPAPVIASVSPRQEVPQGDVAVSPVASLSTPTPVAAAESSPRGMPHVPLAEVRDDVDAQVLPIFLEEAAELYPQAGEEVRAWRRAPGDAGCVRQLRRTLHTFKGSARMAGAMRLGELAHLMESRLVIDDAPVSGSTELFEALDGDLDRIAYVLDALREGRTNVPLTWATERDEASATAEPGAPVGTVVPGAAPASPPAEPTVVVSLPVPGASARVVPDAAQAESGARAMLRVRADIIDRLVNEAGEVAIARARIESELRALKANLLELTGSVVRLRTQVREIEIQAESQIQSRLMQMGEGQEGFDPLEFDQYTRFQELARSLSEGVNDVSTVQQSLLKNLDVADAALVAQGRLARGVQQQLFSIRTVPFGSLSERLYRIMRGTARELGKRANLEIRGGQTELDRAVLEKLVGPLEHLLRNALDHGIEPRARRAKAGKSETGEITLTVRQVANEIAIELTDDGAGLRLDQLRAKAVANGRIAADAQPTDAQLIAWIFEPGFSTASRVTQVSGRGIGMDVVRSEITALGGRVEVSTRVGQGTTFLLYLPLTLAVAQAVMVRAGGRLWALPAPMVEQVLHVKADALVNMYVQRRVEAEGLSYPFQYLPRLLGDSHQIPESTRSNPVLLLRSGQSVAAVHVDEMVGNQEVVVKNIGPQLARVSGIAGATVLGNGEVVLIINPVQLAQRADVPEFDPDAERVAPEVPKMAVQQAERPLVMIVDDSLTVRRITSRLLTREGFDVLTARDGIDALELLQTETPDVILLDIEMPRMDGFEFARTIKGNPTSARIPIVMITSRTAEKHRNHARELGVDLYLGKPFQEEELLRHLREMLALTP